MFYVGGRLELSSGLDRDTTPFFAFRWMRGLAGEGGAGTAAGARAERVAGLPANWLWAVRSPSSEEGDCLVVHLKKNYASSKYVLSTRDCDQGGIIGICEWHPRHPSTASPVPPRKRPSPLPAPRSPSMP